MQQQQFIDLQDQLNMFRAIFTHLHERKTEIFTTYSTVSCKDGYICISIFAGHYTTCHKSQSYAPKDGQKIARNRLS